MTFAFDVRHVQLPESLCLPFRMRRIVPPPSGPHIEEPGVNVPPRDDMLRFPSLGKSPSFLAVPSTFKFNMLIMISQQPTVIPRRLAPDSVYVKIREWMRQ